MSKPATASMPDMDVTLQGDFPPERESVDVLEARLRHELERTARHCQRFG
jgi:hypothetical protein